jgi:hypothetical protein
MQEESAERKLPPDAPVSSDAREQRRRSFDQECRDLHSTELAGLAGESCIFLLRSRAASIAYITDQWPWLAHQVGADALYKMARQILFVDRE